MTAVASHQARPQSLLDSNGWLGALGRFRARPRSVPRAPKAPERLVIVGNGMVGHRFCERLVELGAAGRFSIVVLGEEPTPAYDRVHLTDILRGRPKEELLLRDGGWYGQQGITLELGERAVAIDRDARVVRTQSGALVPYDRLVLATGSRVVLPEVIAESDAGVLSYRTLGDAERILSELAAARATGAPIAIIGGGLLGIEAARAFQQLGLPVVVLEAASQLLPRQLDPDASTELERTLRDAGMVLMLRTRIEHIERNASGVRIALADGRHVDAGAVVAAVGARPHDDLGKAAGLRCNARGGVEVNSELVSSDPRIHAIGECASHRLVPHGLVAPGYAMADVLARRLAGRRGAIGPQHAITRLKLDMTEVTVLGSPAEAAYDANLVFQAPGVYRRLLVKNRRVVAAVSVGAWAELPELQGQVAAQQAFDSSALERFTRSGMLRAGGKSLSVVAWPDAAIVCQCAGITRGMLRRAQAEGHTSVAMLSQKTSAGTLCGSCRPLLAELAGGGPAEVAPAAKARGLAVASFLALMVALATALIPRVRLPAHLRDFTFHVLWTDSTFKQVTGFTVLAAIVLGLSLSLRKRVRRLASSPYAPWRLLHAGLGVFALFGLVAHTGFRLGHNVDRVLTVIVLVAGLTGAGVGLLAALRRAQEGWAATASTWVRRAHDVAFWVLVPLLAIHVIKTYYY